MSRRWGDEERERLKQLVDDGKSNIEIAGILQRTKGSIDNALPRFGFARYRRNDEGVVSISQDDDGRLENLVLTQIKNPTSIIDIANSIDVSPNMIQDTLQRLYDKGYNFDIEQGDVEKLYLSKHVKPRPPLVLNVDRWFDGDIIKFGAVSDTHLGSVHERMDVLDTLYDIFAEEGVKVVYHGGNYIDGETNFIGKHEQYVHGLDAQINNFLEKYPKRDGITTMFISGDDHEGWYYKRESIDVGRLVELRQKDFDRDDLKYLGYVEADIELKNKRGRSMMRVLHGGGGTAYALSYTPQKIIESYQSGEKPHILLIGHYHKAEYMFYRDVHSLQMGCTEDQTTFMRKKKLPAHVGGWLIEMHQAKDGSINRFKPEFFPFFDRKFYDGKSDYTLK